MGTTALLNRFGPDSEVAGGKISLEDFIAFHDDQFPNNLRPEWIEAMIYVPFVTEEDRPAYEAVGRSVYGEDYAFREPAAADGELGEIRSSVLVYGPDLYHWPFDDSLQGTDFMLGPFAIQNAIDRAVSTRVLTSSIPFTGKSGKEVVSFTIPLFLGPDKGEGDITGVLLFIMAPFGIAQLPHSEEIEWAAIVDPDPSVNSLSSVAIKLERDPLEPSKTKLQLTNRARLEKEAALEAHKFFTGSIVWSKKDYAVWAIVSRPTTKSTHLMFILIALGIFVSFFTIVLIMETQNYRSSVLRAKMEQLREKRAADNALAANRILSSISHDIRTPMNGIMGAVCLLSEDGGLNEQQKEYIDICMSCSDSLLHLINDYLDYNKLGSGTIVLHPCLTSVHRLFQDVSSICHLRSEEQGISLEFVVHSSVPEVVMIDPWRVKQVLLNLVTNSLKFTPRGGMITVEARMQDGGRWAPCFLEYSVTDTGIGIAKEDIDTVFRPFRQLETGKRDFKGEGVGLGLSICRELVTLMGGDITCSSTPHVHTAFKFSVHVEPEDSNVNEGVMVEAQPTRSPSSPGSPESNSSCSSHTFLAVDDSKVNLRILTRYIETGFSGCEVLTAMNGQEALDAFGGCKDVSICLMDLNMPIMDGVESVRLMRLLEAEEGRSTRCLIIAVTAASLPPGEREQLSSVGFDDIIPKPVTKSKFLSTVRKNLGRHQQASSTCSSSFLADN
jgi:signal transduction histidine kinase/CheY-like chemotaxis protein